MPFGLAAGCVAMLQCAVEQKRRFEAWRTGRATEKEEYGDVNQSSRKHHRVLNKGSCPTWQALWGRPSAVSCRLHVSVAMTAASAPYAGLSSSFCSSLELDRRRSEMLLMICRTEKVNTPRQPQAATKTNAYITPFQSTHRKQTRSVRLEMSQIYTTTAILKDERESQQHGGTKVEGTILHHRAPTRGSWSSRNSLSIVLETKRQGNTMRAIVSSSPNTSTSVDSFSSRASVVVRPATAIAPHHTAAERVQPMLG